MVQFCAANATKSRLNSQTKNSDEHYCRFWLFSNAHITRLVRSFACKRQSLGSTKFCWWFTVLCTYGCPFETQRTPFVCPDCGARTNVALNNGSQSAFISPKNVKHTNFCVSTCLLNRHTIWTHTVQAFDDHNSVAPGQHDYHALKTKNWEQLKC